MTLEEKGRFILSRLEDAGFEAFFVGGFVRDALMGRAGQDIDLTTNALPQQVEAVFPGFPVLETGIRHGTVTVLIDHTPFEITTYRTEHGYSDARHPDAVAFTRSLTQDLARRDFTVNAMAKHPEKGLVDLFGGQADLEKKVVRCVGEPARRFQEDALRILRGLRFASVLGFSVEPKTAAAMRSEKARMKALSAERISAEWKKLLCGENAGQVILEFWDVLAVIFPFLEAMHGFDQRNPHHVFDVLTHTAVAVDSIAPVPRLRLAAFFHDCGKPQTFSLDADGVGHFYAHANVSAEIAERTLTALRFDKATRERVVQLVKVHDAPVEATRPAVRRKLNRLGEEAFFDLLALQRADTCALAPQYHARKAHFDAVEAIANALLAEDACFSVRSLAVNGNDLLARGYRGKAVGDALALLVAAVMEERVKNEKAALLAYLDAAPQKDA